MKIKQPAYYCIFLRIYLLKMSCGKRREWHFWAPKFEKFYGGPCPQTPLVCDAFGGPTFLSVRTPSKPQYVSGISRISWLMILGITHSLFTCGISAEFLMSQAGVASHYSTGYNTFTQMKIAAHRLSHGAWLLFAVSPPEWWGKF